MAKDFDIYSYDSARTYLTHAMKKQSLRGFCKRASLKSPATMSLILRGKRAISPEVAEKLALALQLEGRRKNYFFSLCRLGNVRNSDEKALFEEQMLHQRSLARSKPLEVAHFRFLMHWYYVVIYVLAGLEDFKPEPEMLARKIGNGVNAHEIRRALSDLELLGMLKLEKDRWVQGMGQMVKTSEDVTNLAIQKFHRQMAALAVKSLAGRVEDREITGLTLAVPADQLPSLKEKIRNFREEVDRLTDQTRSGSRVYQLNIQFFPLTRRDFRQES